jgi:hypothetical protein
VPHEIGAELALGVTQDLSSTHVLSDAVIRALMPETRQRIWESVQRQLTPAPAAPANVLAHLARLTAGH